MTSGTKTDDSRGTVVFQGNSTPCNVPSSVKLGYYLVKTWSGGDSPARKKAPYDPKRRWYDQFGRSHYWKPDKPPRRGSSSSLGEHPYNLTLTHRWDGYSSYETYQPTCSAYNRNYFNTNDNWGGSAAVRAWNSSDDYAVIAKLRQQINGSDFDAGVFLGEGREALNMIADTALRIRRSITALRQGRVYDSWHALVQGHWRQPRPPPNVTRREVLSEKQVTQAWIGSNWLQMQYGWLPLLGDVHDGAQFLAHQLSVPLRTVYRATRSIEGGLTPSSPVYTLKGFSSRGKSIKAIVKTVDMPKMSGLTNPATVAWELLPYSFVLDWFLPIGDYLQAVATVDSLTATYVVSYIEKTVITDRIVKPAYASTYRNYQATASLYRKVVLTRSVSSTLDVPLPRFKPLAKAASMMHCLNATALLNQLRK